MKALLEQLSSIQQLSNASLEALRSICTEQEVSKNEDLQSIGQSCRNIYFVNEGLLRVYYFKEEVDITESFHFEGDLVARADSLFNGSPSRKGIQAIEDTQVFAIHSASLFDLYDAHHDIERLFRKVFEAAYVDTVHRIESLQFHTAEERYNNLMEASKGVLNRIPLKHIASYLGITPVSLSRIRAIK